MEYSVEDETELQSLQLKLLLSAVDKQENK